MKEIWKEVEGSMGLLKVSNLGGVWREGKGFTTPHDNGNGYKFVTIPAACIESVGLVRDYVHRLVAKMFIPNPDNLPQVGHKDDNKANNSVDNLYWCSGSQNIIDAHKSGRMVKRSSMIKLNSYSDEVVANAYRDVKMGDEITSTAAKYGMPRTTLSSIMNKRSRLGVTDVVDEQLGQK